MKKYLLIAVATLVVIGAGVLATLHYEKYQTKQTQTKQAQESKESKLTKELAAEKDKNASLVAKYDTLNLECQKGVGAYGLLTAAQVAKIKVPQTPVCGPAVIQ